LGSSYKRRLGNGGRNRGGPGIAQELAAYDLASALHEQHVSPDTVHGTLSFLEADLPKPNAFEQCDIGGIIFE